MGVSMGLIMCVSMVVSTSLSSIWGVCEFSKFVLF
jgi:hypothetical protein